MSLMLTEVGTPIITKDGLFVYLTDFDAFRQRIWNVFNTQYGTNSMFVDYGFDSLGMKDVNPNDVRRALYSYTLDALNPKHIEGLNEIIQLEVNYEDSTGTISVKLQSEYGLYENQFEVNTNEL